MIIIFVLLWFGVLWGMEQETLALEPLPVPSLKEIAVHAVCTHLVDKKIAVDQVREKLPNDIIKLIGSPKDCLPKKLKDIDMEDSFLSDVTSDHRYILVSSNQGLARLDLWMNKVIIVFEEKNSSPSSEILVALSPSGNLVAFLSSEKIWIKDIAQNKVIAEREPIVFRTYDTYVHHISFMGENKLLLFPKYLLLCLSIDKNLEYHGSLKISPSFSNFIGILPTSQECIIYKNVYEIGYEHVAFLRTTLKGEVKNSTTIKGLECLLPEFKVKSIIYEPEMLIAYEQIVYEQKAKYRQEEATTGLIDIISLKDWPETVTSLTRLKYGTKIHSLAFANKGQWLLGIEGAGVNKPVILIIWNWRDSQLIYKNTFELPMPKIFYIDHYSQYSCLFQDEKALYAFDPIKAVAATILASKEGTTSNNNKNVSNDNVSKPKTSTKLGKRCIVS